MENPAIKPFKENRLFSFRLSPAVWLTLIYLLLSISWIIGSDQLAKNIAGSDSHLFEQIQGVKGLLFVAVSAAILFFIWRKFYNDLRLSFQQTETLQEKYNAVNQASREGIFDCDLVTMTARMNDKMRFFFPVNSNEVDNFWEKYKKRLHPDDMDRLYGEFEKVVASGKSDWQLEYQLLGNDNKFYTVISHIYIIRDGKSGDVIRLIGSLQDVTELRSLQAEYYEEQLKNEQRLASSVIVAQEHERDRWARELHDNVCQILGVVKLFASEIKPGNEESARLLDETGKLVLKALNEIRQLSCNIKPPAFTEMTLTDSVQTLVANVNRFKKFEFDLHTEQFNEEELTDEQKLLVYRVIQEQLNNIVKYAKAQKVTATLNSDKSGRMNITVQDNGIGFNTSEIKTGIGLRNIANRVQAYKGFMNVQSSPGAGCTLTASFSL
jgi:two-component system, NarL family, sensor histidine kinase UhpB